MVWGAASVGRVRSDWMAVERERGNLLDTPGRQDFRPLEF
jgi:peptide subunit release factor RF-3